MDAARRRQQLKEVAALLDSEGRSGADLADLSERAESDLSESSRAALAAWPGRVAEYRSAETAPVITVRDGGATGFGAPIPG